MAPFPGNARGSLGAILVLGALTAMAGAVFGTTATVVESGWPVLSLSVTTLLLLLLISLVVRGLIALARLLYNSK
jgi:hypothetical protein